MEYDKFAQGVVSSLGGATPVLLPFQPTEIRMFNATIAATPGPGGIPTAWWHSPMIQGSVGCVRYNATPVDETIYLATGGFSTFAGGLALQYGPSIAISTVSKAGAAVVTTTGAHGLVTGDVVIMSNLIQSGTTGLQQVCNMPFVITRLGANTFSIPFDTSGTMFTAYDVATATIKTAAAKKVLYPFLYAPGVADIAAISVGTTTTVSTTAPHNFVVGQEVAFRIPTYWGTVELNSLPNAPLPGSPKYGYVTAVNSTTQVVVNIDSTGYTAFTAPTVAQTLLGLAPAQILAVGDNNSGSNQFGYQSPVINGSHTINGPAIAGAFVNNSSQGFIIGPSIAGSASDVIYWVAAVHP